MSEQQKFERGTSLSIFVSDRKEDIGALVFHLRIISWQIADFSVEKYHDKLVQIHNMMQDKGSLRIKSHRILIVAKKI